MTAATNREGEWVLHDVSTSIVVPTSTESKIGEGRSGELC